MIKKPWLTIVWFAVWGIFQTYAVFSVVTGSWQRPEAFPEQAYNALIYPDIFFIPVYLSVSVLLFFDHPLGYALGLAAGGAVTYVMIYLFALSGLKGAENLMFDSVFLFINTLSFWQIFRMDLADRTSRNHA